MTKRAGDGELLLLAAREVAAAAAEHGFQHREQLEQFVGDLALAARQAGKAGLEVLRTVSSGKISRPCGT